MKVPGHNRASTSCGTPPTFGPRRQERTRYCVVLEAKQSPLQRDQASQMAHVPSSDKRKGKSNYLENKQRHFDIYTTLFRRQQRRLTV